MPSTTTFEDAQWPTPFIFGSSWKDCSFHGVYSPDTVSCRCEVPWTGASDFVDAAGVQCHIHVYAVAGMHACLLVYILYVFIFVVTPRLGVIRDLMRRELRKQQIIDNTPLPHRRVLSAEENVVALVSNEAVSPESHVLAPASSSSNKSSRRRIGFFGLLALLPRVKNENLLVVVVCFTILFPSIVIFSVLRIVSDFTASSSRVLVEGGGDEISRGRRRLGTDPAMTFLWIAARWGIYITNLVYQPSVFVALLKAESYSAALARRESKIYKVLGTTAILNGTIAAGLIYVAGAVNPGDRGTNLTIARAAFVAFLFISVILFIIFAYRARWMMRKVSKYYNLHQPSATSSHAFLGRFASIPCFTSTPSSQLSTSHLVSSSTPAPSTDGVIGKTTTYASPPTPQRLSPAVQATMARLGAVQSTLFQLNVFMCVLHVAILLIPSLWIAYDYIIPASWFFPMVSSKRFFQQSFDTALPASTPVVEGETKSGDDEEKVSPQSSKIHERRQHDQSFMEGGQYYDSAMSGFAAETFNRGGGADDESSAQRSAEDIPMVSSYEMQVAAPSPVVRRLSGFSRNHTDLATNSIVTNDDGGDRTVTSFSR